MRRITKLLGVGLLAATTAIIPAMGMAAPAFASGEVATAFLSFNNSNGDVHWSANTTGWARATVFIQAELYLDNSHLDGAANQCYNSTACSVPDHTGNYWLGNPGTNTFKLVATGTSSNSNDAPSDTKTVTV